MVPVLGMLYPFFPKASKSMTPCDTKEAPEQCYKKRGGHGWLPGEIRLGSLLLVESGSREEAGCSYSRVASMGYPQHSPLPCGMSEEGRRGH